MTEEQKEALDYFKYIANREIDELYEFFDEIFEMPQARPYLSTSRGHIPGTDSELFIDIDVVCKDPKNDGEFSENTFPPAVTRNRDDLTIYLAKMKRQILSLLENNGNNIHGNNIGMETIKEKVKFIVDNNLV